MQNTKVVIAGAGPVGLLAAVSLVKDGVMVRIFEAKEKRQEWSKALVVHSGMLEYLEFVHPEVLEKFLARGKKIRGMRFGKKYRVDAGMIPSKYNFLLVIEQSETEEILEQHLASLGGKVEKSCKLIDAKNEETKVISKIQNGDEIFEVTSDYLLDCSGAHSVIRKDILKIPFRGEKYFGRLLMADIKVESDMPEDSGFVTKNENGIAAFVPLTAKDYFRAIIIPRLKEPIPTEISIDYFLRISSSIAPQIKLSPENKWLTSFEISKRLAQHLRVGRIFLAGDAAHIHSPVGGQGMNLGMQDALNISFKLKRVLVDGVDEKILDDYEKQRMPIIIDVLKSTNAAMKSGVEQSFLSLVGIFLIQKLFAPILFHSKFLQKKLLTKLSQIKSARQEIEWRKL